MTLTATKTERDPKDDLYARANAAMARPGAANLAGAMREVGALILATQARLAEIDDSQPMRASADRTWRGGPTWCAALERGTPDDLERLREERGTLTAELLARRVLEATEAGDDDRAHELAAAAKKLGMPFDI